jgi:crotonobetainyl-CoA:carnitine CoA-transferase CaiB-like acyl-CoA transferase
VVGAFLGVSLEDGQTDEQRTSERAGVTMALAGVKVVDISNFLAGPMVSMYLADFGAEVVKVERPSGDELRRWGRARDGVGLFHKMVNRGKKLVTADLRTPLGVEVVLRLVRDADLLVENFRPGTLERWGLGPDVLHGVNPRLVVLRISGFGQTGPYAPRPGFGTLAEAFCGYAHITGHADGPPLLPGFGLADGTTALGGAFLALVALLERDRGDSPGQVIDLAIYEELLTILGPQVLDYDQLGVVQGREGSRLPFTSPRNTYRTADDHWVAVSGSGQATFERMCAALGLEDVASDPRFVDNRARLAHAEVLDAELAEAIGRLPLADLLDRFEQFEAPVAPLLDVAALAADPHVVARGSLTRVFDEELADELLMQQVVGRLSRTPGQIRWAGGPVGQHNREVLVERLGFDPADLAKGGVDL